MEKKEASVKYGGDSASEIELVFVHRYTIEINFTLKFSQVTLCCGSHCVVFHNAEQQ